MARSAPLAIIAGAAGQALAEDVLKVAIPQRGAWDAGVAELGERGGIFKKHGLKLEILYTQAGPESIQALIGGSIDIATASGVSAAVGTFAKGAPIRIIGSEMIGSPDLYWYVPTASPIKTIQDFNGKTVAYSLTGSSSHAALLALIAQYKLTAKPTSTGNIAATITQTMSGQVDVGFGAAPFGLDLVEDGKIRIIATGSDVASLRSRTVRVNLTNVNTLKNRHDALVRFNRAYAETVDWMYSDPAALKHYSDYSNLPEKIVLRVRKLIPKENLATGQHRGDRWDHVGRSGGKIHSGAAVGRAGQGTDPDPDDTRMRLATEEGRPCGRPFVSAGSMKPSAQHFVLLEPRLHLVPGVLGGFLAVARPVVGVEAVRRARIDLESRRSCWRPAAPPSWLRPARPGCPGRPRRRGRAPAPSCRRASWVGLFGQIAFCAGGSTSEP